MKMAAPGSIDAKECPVKNVLVIALFGCLLLGPAQAEELPRVMPKEVGLSAAKLARVKTLVQAAVDKNQTAGVVVLIARRGKVAYLEAFGKLNASTGEPMSPDAIFRIHSAKDMNGDSPLCWASWYGRPDSILRRLCYGQFHIRPDRRSMAANLLGQPHV
jgi:hypothetical protein